MEFFLLAAETLAVTWLLVALVVAMASRRSVWTRWLAALSVVAVCLAFYGWLIFGVYHEEYVEETAKIGLVRPLVVLGGLFVVGAALVLRRGFRRAVPSDITATDGSAAGPSARQWPRGRIALALVAVVALGALTLTALDAVVRLRVDLLRSEATARALAAAPESPVAAEDNAATYYLALAPALVRLDKHPWYEAWLGHNETDEDFDYRSAEANAFMETCRGEIDLLRRAGSLPQCVFDRSYGLDSAAQVISTSEPMRDAARLLSAHALWSSAHGDVKSALADVTALSGLAHHAAQDVSAVSLLMGVAIDGVTFDTLQRVLRSRDPASDELSAADVQPWFSFRRQMPRILRDENAILLNSAIEADSLLVSLGDLELPGFGQLASGFRFDTVSWLQIGPLYRIFVLMPDIDNNQRDMRRVYNSTELPYDKFQQRCERLAPEIEGKGLLDSAASSLLGSIEAAYRADAYHLVAYTALAMHRYRAEHGKFPATLAELAPATIPLVPTDPYSEQPLKLKQTDRGWVVYSIGPDTTDDQGQPWDWEVEQGDFAFEYVAPQGQQEPRK
jgi:hypothetical protein